MHFSLSELSASLSSKYSSTVAHPYSDLYSNLLLPPVNELLMVRFPYQYSFFYPRHYLCHLQQLEPWQMDRSSCRAWRRASTWAETGTGMVGEAAASTTAATGVPGVVVGQQPGRNRCRGNCLVTLYPRPGNADMLHRKESRCTKAYIPHPHYPKMGTF